ncbi:MAG: hypothetical protein ACLU38_04660 [Dysosmobacter sp.]
MSLVPATTLSRILRLLTLTSAQKKAEEANVEFTFFDKDGNVLASASGLAVRSVNE